MNNYFDLKDNLKSALYDIAAYDYLPFFQNGDFGMFKGMSGISVFYFQMYLFSHEEKYRELCGKYFMMAYESLELSDFSLSNGVSGFMWLVNHFKGLNAFESNFEDILLSYDRNMGKVIEAYQSNLDPMHGLLGIANYILERNIRNKEVLIKKIVDIIDDKKMESNNGVYWLSGTNDPSKNMYKHINIGYAHGMPSILFTINKIRTAGVYVSRCSHLLRSGLNFLKSYYDDSAEEFFPNRIKGEEVLRKSRISFCYGDLGVSYGLTIIGNSLGDLQILHLAKKTAIHVAKRSLENGSNDFDIGLCHGNAGRGYLFYKLYRVFKSNYLKQAAYFNYKNLLEIRKIGQGIAGFTAIDYNDDTQSFQRKAMPGFMDGVAGVGLSIISYLNSRINEHWNKILNLG